MNGLLWKSLGFIAREPCEWGPPPPPTPAAVYQHYAASFEEFVKAHNVIKDIFQFTNKAHQHFKRLGEFAANGGGKFRLQGTLEDGISSFTTTIDEWADELADGLDLSADERLTLSAWRDACCKRFQTIANCWKGDDNPARYSWKSLTDDIIEPLKKHFVFVPTDESPQTVAVICRKHYIAHVTPRLNTYRKVTAGEAKRGWRRSTKESRDFNKLCRTSI